MRRRDVVVVEGLRAEGCCVVRSGRDVVVTVLGCVEKEQRRKKILCGYVVVVVVSYQRDPK